MDINLNIEKKDISYVKEFLKGKVNPIELDEVVLEVALFKTQDKRKNKVKIYNPNCEYKVNDLIFKVYPGKIPIGSKKYIEMEKGVVLKIDEIRTRFDVNEIKLIYEGTSDFKKYTDYLQRQKIELLLPHKQGKTCEKPEYLPESKDPRQKQDPLIQKDFNTLKKKLSATLNKSQDMALISNRVLLIENMKPLKTEVFNKIKEFLKENKRSETTEFLVENLVKIKSEDKSFNSYCFALNYRMKKEYKIDFQQTNNRGWGKWNLISVIYYMKKESLMSEENPILKKVFHSDKKNIGQRRKKFEENLFSEENFRFLLTQREVSSDALRLKPGIFNFGDSIEIEVTDINTKKTHILYYYKDVNLILGFKEIYEHYKALQGMIVTFEQTEDEKFQFSIKTTKKGTVANKINYIPEKKAFSATEEKIASPVFVNKSMFIEPETINEVFEKIDEFRKIDTMNKLVHKIFLEFGSKEKNYEIHILRLYHILDLIFPVDLKYIEEIVLSNPEFVPSEKITGVFYLDSESVIEIEEEERQRREVLIKEAKKRRDETRKKKLDEEIKIKDEIRRKREERRKKREQEMWMKEKMDKERELKIQVQQRKKEAPGEGVYIKGDDLYIPKEKGMKRKFEPVTKKKSAAAARQKSDFQKFEETFPMDEPPTKKAPPKRMKKKIEEEKPVKVPKRVDKKPEEEIIDIEDLKSEIKLEELKEKIKERETVKKKVKKEEKIAYKDNGGFGGIFASKLDEVVQKKTPKKKKKDSKK